MSEETTTSEEAVEGTDETATEETTAAEVEKTWRDDLPSELQGIKTLEKFKDVSGLAKSYVETEKYFEGAVRIPGEGATDDDWSSFYGKLGRPDTAEDYDFEKAEMPDGMEYNSDFEKQYLEMAHKNGYSNAQVKAGYDWYNGISKNAHVDQTVVKENNIQKAEIELRSDWGRQFDEKMAGIGRLIDQYSDQGTNNYLDESGIGNDPHLAKFLDKIATDFGEAKHLGDPRISAFTNPEAAQKAKDAFYQDTQSEDYKAYFDAKHPKHNEAVKMLERWNNTIHGDA
jgi:hypothetical protein